MIPKISIIVPVYNVEKYLKENADSILKQTWQNFELIFVDDGSNDKSGEICDLYQSKDNRVKVIHKQNEGLGYARNSGLDIAEGEYAVFIDSDDYIDNDFLMRLIQPILFFEADTCIGGFKRVSNDGNVLYKEQYKNEIYKEKDVYQKFFIRILGSYPKYHDNFKMSVWNGIYSMKIIREHCIRFPSEKVMISEDLIFDSEYYKYAQQVVVIDSVAYNYRVNPNSLTNKYKEKKFQLVTELYIEMEKRIKNSFLNYNEALYRLQVQYFINLRDCIKQENRKQSLKSFFQNHSTILKICKYPVVKQITYNYPLNRLNFQQKLFVLLLRYKCSWILTILSEFNRI